VTRERAFFLGILAVSLAAGASAVAIRDRVVPETQVSGRPIQIAGDGYVTSTACQACHPSQYASWHRSYHRTMTQVATAESIAARFDDVLERRGREIWSRDAAGAAVRVAMTTGSHHQQIFWYETGSSRVVGQLPVI